MAKSPVLPVARLAEAKVIKGKSEGKGLFPAKAMAKQKGKGLFPSLPPLLPPLAKSESKSKSDGEAKGKGSSHVHAHLFGGECRRRQGL